MFSHVRTFSVLMWFQELPWMKTLLQIRGQRSPCLALFIVHLISPNFLKIWFDFWLNLPSICTEQPINARLQDDSWELQLPVTWHWCVGTSDRVIKAELWYTWCSHDCIKFYLQRKWPAVKECLRKLQLMDPQMPLIGGVLQYHSARRTNQALVLMRLSVLLKPKCVTVSWKNLIRYAVP